MGDVEIELWTEREQPDYARILSSLDDDVAKELYEYLWEIALEWTEEKDEEPDLFKRLTGRHVDVAEVLEWFEQEGFLTQMEEEERFVFVPDESVQESLQVEAKNRTVPYKD